MTEIVDSLYFII